MARKNCYIAVAAEIDNELNTRYTVKIGSGDSPRERCDKQRLKMLGYTANARMSMRIIEGVFYKTSSLETFLQNYATELGFVQPDYGYKAAGYTEMRGDFETIREALKLAETLLAWVRAECDWIKEFDPKSGRYV